jgi:glycosyltransferase involved in cell wall biosynthesis
MSTNTFIMAQVGARRSYAVPAMLASAGMLETFYTDICGNVGFGRALSFAGLVMSSAARLQNRRVPPAVVPRTKTFPIRTLLHICQDHFTSRDPQSRFRSQCEWQRSLGQAAARCDRSQATHFFSMLGEFSPLLLAARERGLAVVTEIYTLISLETILAKERARYPAWEPEDHDLSSVRREFPDHQVMLSSTNHFLCPSDSVRDDLVLHHGVAASSTAVIPYGVDPRWLELTPSPQPRRILTTGRAGLGKGTHYLGMAAERLASRNRGYDFRVAGHASPAVVQQPICRNLNFLGRVDRDKIPMEYQAADLFVLPTLAEGSAESVYEAMASGLPVVTTKSAGSVVRDGIEGRIVPERDPDALADAIQELTEDRPLRDRMAVAARERAKDFTWGRYGERLLAYLKSLPS